MIKFDLDLDALLCDLVKLCKIVAIAAAFLTSLIWWIFTGV